MSYDAWDIWTDLMIKNVGSTSLDDFIKVFNELDEDYQFKFLGTLLHNMKSDLNQDEKIMSLLEWGHQYYDDCAYIIRKNGPSVTMIGTLPTGYSINIRGGLDEKLQD